MIILISGYRGSGKDTLCAKLIYGNSINLSKFNWRVYSKKKTPLIISKIDNLSIYRIGFADALKKEVHQQYLYSSEITGDKDVKSIIHNRTQELVSPRDLFIEWGNYCRSLDPDHWCRCALATYFPNTCCIVTDWRFTNEARYAIDRFDTVITIRIYRSAVNEPDINIESEHNLDNYLADYLVVPDGLTDEFEKAVKRFPQYQDYQLVNVI